MIINCGTKAVINVVWSVLQLVSSQRSLSLRRSTRCCSFRHLVQQITVTILIIEFLSRNGEKYLRLKSPGIKVFYHFLHPPRSTLNKTSSWSRWILIDRCSFLQVGLPRRTTDDGRPSSRQVMFWMSPPCAIPAAASFVAIVEHASFQGHLAGRRALLSISGKKREREIIAECWSTPTSEEKEGTRSSKVRVKWWVEKEWIHFRSYFRSKSQPTEPLFQFAGLMVYLRRTITISRIETLKHFRVR